MSVVEDVVAIAARAHRELWAAGKDGGAQTKRSNAVCRAWQEAVKARFPDPGKAQIR